MSDVLIHLTASFKQMRKVKHTRHVYVQTFCTPPRHPVYGSWRNISESSLRLEHFLLYRECILCRLLVAVEFLEVNNQSTEYEGYLSGTIAVNQSSYPC